MKGITGTRVFIRRKKNNKGKIEIEYYSRDDLERIIDLLWRLAFIVPMLKWLLDTVNKLNKDISTLNELDNDINNNEIKTMEDLQDIQKVIFQHRKECYAIPEWIYNIFKNNDEDRAYREVRMGNKQS